MHRSTTLLLPLVASFLFVPAVPFPPELIYQLGQDLPASPGSSFAVTEQTLTPDGEWVVYRYAQALPFELHAAPVDGSVAPLQISQVPDRLAA